MSTFRLPLWCALACIDSRPLVRPHAIFGIRALNSGLARHLCGKSCCLFRRAASTALRLARIVCSRLAPKICEAAGHGATCRPPARTRLDGRMDHTGPRILSSLCPGHAAFSSRSACPQLVARSWSPSLAAAGNDGEARTTARRKDRLALKAASYRHIRYRMAFCECTGDRDRTM